MNRRTFLCGSIAAALVTPFPARAQQPRKVPRVGFLGSAPTASANAFREGLRELGYVEGHSIVIESRWVADRPERFAELAVELVNLNVDVIIAPTNTAAAAARKATSKIPIVFVLVADPVGLGFVTNLAQPGGNITGLSLQTVDLAAKRQQLFKDAVPTFSRLVILWNPTNPEGRDLVREAEATALALGAQVRLLEVRRDSELDDAFAVMRRERASAVYLNGSILLFAHRERIAQLATQHRLPLMCTGREYVQAGCLLVYAPIWSDLYRRAAGYVDKILKGAKPGDLPVEQPTKFELVINLKTARALGLTIPPSLLLRADQVIE